MSHDTKGFFAPQLDDESKDATLYLASVMNSDNYQDQRLQMFEFLQAAQQAERWEDMINILNSVIIMDTENSKNDAPILMSQDELHFLTVAFKQATSIRRTAWRTMCCDEARANPLVNLYCTQIEEELRHYSTLFITLLTKHLIPAQRRAIQLAADLKPNQLEFAQLHPNVMNYDQDTHENMLALSLQLHQQSLVLYLKLLGDYNRYLAELLSSDTDFGQQAKEAYHEAFLLAKSPVQSGDTTEVLPRVHPTRLGLALNYAVCFYEILDEREMACAIARDAFEAALSNLGHLDEHVYKDSTLLLTLLRDNLTLWGDIVNDPRDQTWDDYDEDFNL